MSTCGILNPGYNPSPPPPPPPTRLTRLQAPWVIGHDIIKMPSADQTLEDVEFHLETGDDLDDLFEVESRN